MNTYKIFICVLLFTSVSCKTPKWKKHVFVCGKSSGIFVPCQYNNSKQSFSIDSGNIEEFSLFFDIQNCKAETIDNVLLTLNIRHSGYTENNNPYKIMDSVYVLNTFYKGNNFYTTDTLGISNSDGMINILLQKKRFIILSKPPFTPIAFLPFPIPAPIKNE